MGMIAIPHRDVPQLTVIRSNGTSTSLFNEVSGKHFPSASFPQQASPLRFVRRWATSARLARASRSLESVSATSDSLFRGI